MASIVVSWITFWGFWKKKKKKHTIHYNTNTWSCRLLPTIVIGTSLFTHNHLWLIMYRGRSCQISHCDLPSAGPHKNIHSQLHIHCFLTFVIRVPIKPSNPSQSDSCSGEACWTWRPSFWHHIRWLMWPHVPPLTWQTSLITQLPC